MRGNNQFRARGKEEEEEEEEENNDGNGKIFLEVLVVLFARGDG